MGGIATFVIVAASRDRCEPAASDDGRHGKTAAPVAEPAVGGVIEFLREIGAVDERAHENEQRQHREVEIHRKVDDLLRAHRESARHAADRGEADSAHEDHREPQRQTEEGEQQQDAQADQRDFH
jgi:hypothetical protein